MNIRARVQLTESPKEADIKEARAVAARLTNAGEIEVYPSKDKPNSLIVEFSVNQARQEDVVDPIARAFRRSLSNYDQISISFPKQSQKTPLQPQSRYTRKQGQYLAFIYYYTKLHGYPPAEADMQRYFKTSPPTVHNMVEGLVKKGLISKTPSTPRSIQLSLSRQDIPDLE